MALPLTIREDDLCGPEIKALITLHLSSMHQNTPLEHSFALDLRGLQKTDITVWSAWAGPSLAGMGALRDLGLGAGEIKSMRTHPDFLRQGVATQILGHIIASARNRGMTRLSLETGNGADFEAALGLYRSRGFVPGEAFADYRPSLYCQFLHLPLGDEESG